jgi:hypothetical protein
MQACEWKQMRHFGPNEDWGEPSKMDFGFVSELDAFREFLKEALVVTHGTQGQHAEGSLHYSGEAADLIYLGRRPLIDVFFTALRFDFTGLGLYRDWEFNGKRVGGLHLQRAGAQLLQPKRLWLNVSQDNTKLYLALTAENIINFKFLEAP